MGVEEVETMSTLTIEEPTLGKTMSTSGTLVGTPSTIPSMQGCNTKELEHQEHLVKDTNARIKPTLKRMDKWTEDNS